jgi:hypothetical protein
VPTPQRRRPDNARSMSSDDSDTTLLSLDRDDVARRAFELYCARGREDGHDLDDWLSAERALRAAASVSTAA